MIPKLRRFTERINQLTPAVMNGIVASSLNANKEIFADLITGQLEQGIKGDGENLKTYASAEYAAFKRSIGSKSSPVTDLKLTGAYHRSIMLEASKDKAAIVSTDNKDEELSLKYGDEIKQLTPESKKEGRQQIKPDMQIRINKIIFK